MMLVFGMLSGVALAGDPCADEAAVAERSAALEALYDAGEADRQDRSAAATTVLKRDEQRVKAAVKLDKKGRLCTPEDKWRAAWLMTQADDAATLERAYELAQESMNAHYANGPWLVAYVFDLKRVFGGYLQAYGTQTRVDASNRRCLVKIDPEISDADRAQYGQPPLTEVYRKVLDLNGFRDDAPTLERLERHSLYCDPVAGTR
ncbi:MAG: hypothetical protein R3F59_34905, partial [Myxococcota bacterium]